MRASPILVAILFVASMPAKTRADAVDDLAAGAWYEVPSSHLSSVFPDPPLPGDARRARRALESVVELDSGNFKARVGLADIALREGKLAHVIHHYQ